MDQRACDATIIGQVAQDERAAAVLNLQRKVLHYAADQREGAFPGGQWHHPLALSPYQEPCGVSPRAKRALISSITAGSSTMVSIR